MTIEPKIISGPSHNPAIPEIYQVEVCSRCDLACNFCHTGTSFGGKVSKDSFIDVDLVKLIAERDIKGSYFIELQHRGEPTLHKQLEEIVDILKPHVMLGLSTHGGLIHKRLNAILKLDYLTISMDAVNKEDYEQMRKGGNFERLVSNIDLLLEARGDSATPHIDLQFLDIPGYPHKFEEAKEFVANKNWDVTARRLPDCFPESNSPGKYKVVTDELCVNPWTSVSIQENGDVAACCRAWSRDNDPKLYYGNLYEQSLEEIWETSENLKSFRHAHRTNEGLPYTCQSCWQRSPYFLHNKLVNNAMVEINRRKRMKEAGIYSDTYSNTDKYRKQRAEQTLTEEDILR